MEELTQGYVDAYMTQTAAEWAKQGCEQPTDHDVIGAFLGLAVILGFLAIVALAHWRKSNRNKK